MRVLIQGGVGLGGTQRAAKNLAQAMAKRGHQVFLAAGAQDGCSAATASKKANFLFVGSPIDRPCADRLLAETRPDLVYLSTPGYELKGALVSALASQSIRDRPTVVEAIHFSNIDLRERELTPDLFLFVSKSACALALKRAGISLNSAPTKFSYLYNLLDPESEVPTQDRERMREYLGFGHTDIVFVRVGQTAVNSWGKWSKWEVEALRLARMRDSRIRLVLQEPTMPAQRWIRGLGEASNIRILPQTENRAHLRALYTAADAMVHASSYGESFGYTIAEAMEARLPVVARSTPWGDNAQLELIVHGKTGFICQSVLEMAERMLQLAASPDTRMRLGASARETITHLLVPEREVSFLEAFFHARVKQESCTELAARWRAIGSFASALPRLEAPTPPEGIRIRISRLSAWCYGTARCCRSQAGRWLRSAWKRSKLKNRQF